MGGASGCNCICCGAFRVLRRLIAATDKRCGSGRGQVSPLYLAVHSNQRSAVELLLQEGFSADAQDCDELLGLRSPLSLALRMEAEPPCSR